MDFELTTEQKDIQKAALEFARGEFDPDDALLYDRNQQFPSKIWKMACELGFIGLHFPEKYEGQELGLLENALAVEAFCRQDSGIGMALALSYFGSEMVLRHGNEDQKKLILPYAAQGKGILTVAFLEEDFSLAPLATTAKAGENSYVIDGKKSFVTLGSMAGYMIVACQTDPDDPHARSFFLVEREIDGMEISSMGEKLGMRMVPMDVVSLTGVTVPKENRLSQEEKGSSRLKDFLD
ncbi:MAG TPA: acyl-CoA dehydrogenase [Desulfobacteraceae bacterium]|nr:acyl-CoA dehydrogenase [Desulfobacteraceae bacterium]